MKKVYAALELSAQSDKKKQDRRIAKKRDDPLFRSQLQSIRQKISGGQTLYDIRHTLGVKDDRAWGDLISCLARSVYSPESAALEWVLKQNSRYTLAADFLNRAKAANDLDNEAKGIMMLCKIDEDMMELHKALGLIKPVYTDDEGSGFSSDDIATAQERLDKIAEQHLINKLAAERETQSPESVTLLPGLEARGETNSVGEASLAENNSDGPVAGHQNSEGLANGSFNPLSDQVVLDVKNQNNPAGNHLLATNSRERQ